MLEGEYYFAKCPTETDLLLMVEKHGSGYFLMGSERPYPSELIEIVEGPIVPRLTPE